MINPAAILRKSFLNFKDRSGANKPPAPKAGFLICGTQKGGTSALDHYLRAHPEIGMAREKEVHYFDNDSHFLNAAPDYAAYHAAFSPAPSHKILGEATPIYMYWHEAPRRIQEYNPEIKLIVLLRNPVQRAFSHWNMERARNLETLSFQDAIQNETGRCRTALPGQHRIFSYVDRGFYMAQLRRLWSFFPRENVLVLRSEDLKNAPLTTLQEVCRHLGVQPFRRIAPKTVHRRAYPSALGGREKDYLRSVYEKDIRELEQALGWDCRHWLAD